MKRLTNPLYQPICKDNVTTEDIFHKLIDIEDLEEELGIPFDVLLNAFKKGIYVCIDGKDKPVHTKVWRMDYHYYEGDWTFTTELIFDDEYLCVKLKDYGKTWSLVFQILLFCVPNHMQRKEKLIPEESTERGEEYDK